MLKNTVKKVLNSVGLSLHHKQAIDNLHNELQSLRASIKNYAEAWSLQEKASPQISAVRKLIEAELALQQSNRCLTTEDYDAPRKQKHLISEINDFGQADFADLCVLLFASSLNNHRIIHQRFDEGSLLWRAVKRTGGPILEVGRAAGGSTVAILGASGDRRVISIDRDPQHSWITNTVFERPDVRKRLTLYTQSSRESIPEAEFGMMFVDGDHSYEGVCSDIASFWNCLKSFDGKPPLAAFHDAAANPISYVEPVHRACQELVANRNVARVVENWGSMLLVEKVGDIATREWRAKEDADYWRRFGISGTRPISVERIESRLNGARQLLVKGTSNLLEGENFDRESWIKNGVQLKSDLNAGADNPIRLVEATPGLTSHSLTRTIPLDLARFSFTIFARPIAPIPLRLSIADVSGTLLAHVDFDLKNRSEVSNPKAANGIELLDAGFLYCNGFFRCELSIEAQRPIPAATFTVQILGENRDEHFVGKANHRFFVNLASIRAIQ